MQTTFTLGAIFGDSGPVTRGWAKLYEEIFQEQVKKLLRPFFKAFFAPFRPSLTDCSWAFEDDLVQENVFLLGTYLNKPFSGTYTRIPVTKYKVDILYSGSKRGTSSKCACVYRQFRGTLPTDHCFAYPQFPATLMFAGGSEMVVGVANVSKD